MIAQFRIAGYTVILIGNIFWHMSHKSAILYSRKRKLNEAIMKYGTDVGGAIKDVFTERYNYR
jgi:hypothetical protein